MLLSNVMKPVRPLALGLLFALAATATAHAQTVIVRNVPAGDAIEVFVNGKKLTAFTDDENVLSGGRLVLYNEDSWARFDDLHVALTPR